MALCNRCADPIFFAWDRKTERWSPCELTSIRDGDTEYGSGLHREPHHRRHRCGLRQVRADVGPHATLYLLPSAPLEVVRAAHRALAALHHPDVGGNEERMVEINLAYDEIMGNR